MSRTVKKPYSKAKNWDKHCRNNNACSWCRDNRLHKHKKQMIASPLNETFEELYEVVFDYQKDDGYWSCSNKEYVLVTIKNGINEKDNHEAAWEIIKKKYKNCKITRSTYC